MITIVKEFTFDAAHQLPNYNGKCSNLHGHTYKLQVGITGKVIDGMVFDFAELKNFVKDDIIEFLDHKYLNELSQDKFPHRNPTAENMVMWISKVLMETLEAMKEKSGFRYGTKMNPAIKLDFVRLWETPTSYAEWRAK